MSNTPNQTDPQYAETDEKPSGEPIGRAAIFAWRKAERSRLLDARMALSPETRRLRSEAIARNLDSAVGDVTGKAISLYWPFRGEPDLRPWMDSIQRRGGRTLLPVVTEKGTPLAFRPWKHGDRLVKGIWNIPVPDTAETALPDICIAPVVGFDSRNFRLGYGGGYFDRTLASLGNRPLVIGIGYTMQRIETIYPLDHDIAMDMIVTDTHSVV